MPSSDVPEYLDYEKVKESGAVERIYEDEDEYSLVYKNADGTRTLYMYDVPIKCENAKGELIDKTLKFSANAKGGYSAEESGIAVNFPEKLSDGISYGEKERSFTIIPNAEPGCTAKLSEDGKSISYAVSESVTIVYSLSFTGIKEDIVIDEYTGENTFTYTLKTDGLYSKTNNGELYLYSSDGECVYSLGDVWVYDSKGINNSCYWL